jgi:hypothetical protein
MKICQQALRESHSHWSMRSMCRNRQSIISVYPRNSSVY